MRLVDIRFRVAANKINYSEFERLMRTTLEQHRRRLAESQERERQAEKIRRANERRKSATRKASRDSSANRGSIDKSVTNQTQQVQNKDL